jgi:hypothetical protein
MINFGWNFRLSRVSSKVTPVVESFPALPLPAFKATIAIDLQLPVVFQDIGPNLF